MELKQLLSKRQCKDSVTEKRSLKKGLKTRHIYLLAIGGAMGSDFFLGTGAVINRTGPAAVFAFLLGGVMLYTVMACLGELAVARPDSGSFITYANDYISPGWACGVGWSYWASWMMYIPCECLAAGIIMHGFFPQVQQYIFTLIFGALIVLFNILNVKLFGEMEFWLTIVKLFSLLMFSVFAVLILSGIVRGSAQLPNPGAGLLKGGIFPTGAVALLSNMVLLMVDFQGAEIIGISVGETKEPEKVIPSAVKSIVAQVVFFYLVPVTLLVLILPYYDANANQCVFSAAFDRYGLHWAGGIFSFVALAAALSCSNSGMYANARVLCCLAEKKMAPRPLLNLNKNSVPQNAVIFTAVCSLAFLAASCFLKAEAAFTGLLSVSGFTGTICSISICISQLGFRKKLYSGGKTEKTLKYKTPGYPFTAYLGAALQVIFLVCCVLSPSLRMALFLGVPMLAVPMIIYKIRSVMNGKSGV